MWYTRRVRLSKPIDCDGVGTPIVSRYKRTRRICNDGKYTWMKFPTPYSSHFCCFVLTTYCELGDVGCPPEQFLFSPASRLSCLLPCVCKHGRVYPTRTWTEAGGQVQKIHASFKKTLIFSFKFNCGVIRLVFSLKSSSFFFFLSHFLFFPPPSLHFRIYFTFVGWRSAESYNVKDLILVDEWVPRFCHSHPSIQKLSSFIHVQKGGGGIWH